MGPRVPAPSSQAGLTYVAVLVLVAIMGVTAAASGDVWHTARRRAAEAELLFVGHEYRQAITRYYERSPGRVKTFPRSLEDLLRDPRVPGTRRHLRKLYADPVAGGGWGLVQGPAGEIMGVHSLSDAEPLKKGNFTGADARFEGKRKYSEWVFAYAPGRSSMAAAGAVPGARPGN